MNLGMQETSSVTLTRVTSIGHINKKIINNKMPSDCAAVLKQPPKTCDVTSFASCLAHQLVFLIISFCAENKHVCVCDLLSVRCLYDKIASSHQTFPSILLCTACIIHRKCNLKKNTLAFIPLNWFFLLKILVL